MSTRHTWASSPASANAAGGGAQNGSRGLTRVDLTAPLPFLALSLTLLALSSSAARDVPSPSSVTPRGVGLLRTVVALVRWLVRKSSGQLLKIRLPHALIVQLSPLQIGFLDKLVEVLEEEPELLTVSVFTYNLFERGPELPPRLHMAAVRLFGL